MSQVPIRPAMVMDVFHHAALASLERMVRSKPARKQAEPELEVGDRRTRHGCHSVPHFSMRHERRIEPQDGEGQRELRRGPMRAKRHCLQASERIGQVMLDTGTAPVKERLAGRCRGSGAPKPMMTAAEAEQGFSGQCLEQRKKTPLTYRSCSYVLHRSCLRSGGTHRRQVEGLLQA